MAKGVAADSAASPDLKRVLRISVTDGVLGQTYSALAGPGSAFLTRLLILLHASPVHFSLLSAVGQIAQVMQPVGLALTRRRTSRKKVILPLLHTARLLTLLFLPVPFLVPGPWALGAFLALFLLVSCLHAVALNGWIAWISDLFPVRMRARFFSIRTLYIMVTGLVTGYAASLFFDLFDPSTSLLPSVTGRPDGFFRAENLPWAFAAVFLVAIAAGLASNLVLSRQPERAKPVESGSLLRALAEPVRDPNFRRLLLYGGWWMLALGIGSPFWQPYMLVNLKMSMIEVQIYGTISVCSSLLVLRGWGRVIDAFGNKTAMRFILLLGGMNAGVWVLVTRETLWIAYLEAATSGIMWAGASLVGTNFVLSVAPRGKAQIYSGVFGAFTGAAMVVTMMVSGLLLPPPMELWGLSLAPEQVLFGLSALGRWSTQIPLTFIHEPRARPMGEALIQVLSTFKLRVVHRLYLLRNGNNAPDGP